MVPVENQPNLLSSSHAIAEFDPYDTSLHPSPDKVTIIADCLPTSEMKIVQKHLKVSTLSSVASFQTLISWRHLLTYPKHKGSNPSGRSAADALTSVGFPSARITSKDSTLKVLLPL